MGLKASADLLEILMVLGHKVPMTKLRTDFPIHSLSLASRSTEIVKLSSCLSSDVMFVLHKRHSCKNDSVRVPAQGKAWICSQG